jgi:hypothetical protein
MITRTAMRRTFALAALLAVAAFPLAAAAADPIARVSGGGTGDFVPHPHAFNTTGFTDFSVGVTVYSDGTASGRFVCMIPAIVVVSLEVIAGTVNDDGSVTVAGLAHGYDAFIPGPYENLPVIVTFRAGGPGVGGFDYVDDSGFFDSDGDDVNDLFDTEVVRRGVIHIRN